MTKRLGLVKGSPDKFSVIRRFSIKGIEYGILTTKSKVIIKNHKKFFQRVIIANPNFNIYKADLTYIQNLLYEYLDQLRKGGILVPRVKDSYVKNNRIIFDSEYKGHNLLQRFNIAKKNKRDILKNNKDVLIKVFDIIRKAQKSNIYLDPHPTNFVSNKESGKLYYVDFSPPYTKQYLKLRLKIANKSQKAWVTKSFKYFESKELGYHLIGDLLRLNPNYPQITRKLYDIMKSKGIVTLSYGQTIRKAHLIKKFEEQRLKKRFFL